MNAPRQITWNGWHVPFIAPWSRETPRVGTIVRAPRGAGIAYADELDAADRRNGTLWVRCPVLRGVGKPNLAGVHPLRQRQAMSHMLCQVCAKSTYDEAFNRWGGRHLFLVRADKGQAIREGETTATPPTCEPCAAESIRACPELRKGYTAALVERPQPWGVAGTLYDPRTLRPMPAPDTRDGLTFVNYEDPQLPWTLAARDVVTLLGCTTVDLDHLAAHDTTV
ncbi:hypothetical protein [Streptomyces sp. NPDC049744]|uniref:hypothetical protein n=1 Tax=Streptomyces sp. NPDC049744 TaxID=3154359 RepID=UPI0034183D4F